MSSCIECHKAYMLSVRRNNLDYYREYDRQRAMLPHRVEARNAYSKTDHGRLVGNKAKRKYTQRNSEKRAAHLLLASSVNSGRIKKMPCSICGSSYRIHGHHEDYAKPLDVIWLCPKHHREIHKNAARR